MVLGVPRKHDAFVIFITSKSEIFCLLFIHTQDMDMIVLLCLRLTFFLQISLYFFISIFVYEE